MKAEHAKVFECMMENSYLFHWEYLLRKARTYAHKYHVPYVSFFLCSVYFFLPLFYSTISKVVSPGCISSDLM